MTQLVTVLIPTYNRAQFLREAIKSAVGQTHQYLEILILDDASPDETAAVAAEFSRDGRVRYIRHPKNLGIVGNWRAGIESASGEYFCLLHDDDTFEPAFVERLLAPMRDDPSLIVAFCDHWCMDTAGQRDPQATDEVSKRFGRASLSGGHLNDFANTALIGSSVPIGATLFRRSAISPDFVTEQAKGSIDFWLLYQCVKTGYPAFYLPERLMNYRLHSGGMSASMPLYMAEGHLFRYESILADQSLTRIHDGIRGQMGATLTAQGIVLLATGKRRAARAALKRAISLAPSYRTAAAYILACGGYVGTRAAAALRH